MVNTNIGNNFEISHCPRCDTKKLGIIGLDEYNQVLVFRCNKCGEEFTRPVEIIVSNIL